VNAGEEASLAPLALASARRERSRKRKALDFERRQRGGNLLGESPNVLTSCESVVGP
jgi:hypothetical protein